MKSRIAGLAGACLSVLTVTAAIARDAAPEPYPLDYWALREVINRAQVSPDGKYLGLMKIASKDGNPVIEVFDAADLSKEPVFRLNADPMEITNFWWVSDNDIVFTLRQKVRNIIEGFNQGVYETKLAVVDVESKKMDAFDEVNPTVEHTAPGLPNKIIISFQEGGDDGPGSKLSEAFRPRAYWQFDVNKGTKELVIRGKLALGNITFNGDGDPILARGFDLADGEYVWYVRQPRRKGWQEVFRLTEDSFENFAIGEPDDTKPGNYFVIANNGDDKTGLWSYNADAKSFEELVYRRSDVDIFRAVYHTNIWAKPGVITGITYFTDKEHIEFFDEVEGAIYRQLMEAIPYAYSLAALSRSRDGGTWTIYNEGPRDPGTFYLLKDKQIKAVGSKQPLLESENLADLDYIRYKARDGRKIRAYVTVPQGEPPFPLVVLPHGGPFVAERVVYDEWAQMLANNGYMVVQPQYRGSFNYGLDFHLISFKNGGQGGHKMQDDKDDAALYLVEEGLADPDRLAMFGWSYGGYAALVAASRTPQIYQCVIAGAAVADQIQQVNYYRWQLRGGSKERQMAYRAGSVNPIDEVAKVNVPILLIHGDVDQRVPITHSNRYRKELDKHGKSYKYVELDGADHFYNTLFYRHQIELYESMIGFLENDCFGEGRDLQASAEK